MDILRQEKLRSNIACIVPEVYFDYLDTNYKITFTVGYLWRASHCMLNGMA